MIDVDIITIDNVDYAVIRKINNYVYLSNPDNPKDFMIRKEVEINGEKYLNPLDNQEEVQKAFALFTE